MIELKHIRKKYKENILFEDVSAVFSSPVIKIAGENGIGKSVLLKMIVGYSFPDSGQVICDGSVLGENGRDFIEDAGIFIDAPQFMSQWSGYDNLAYLADIRKRCSAEKLKELIEYFDLTDDIHKKYRTYSLGMRQKMRLIQAVMDDPKYLILDEPFDSLDQTAVTKTMALLKDHVSAGAGRMMIYTSHSETDTSFTDEIYTIDHHKLVALPLH